MTTRLTPPKIVIDFYTLDDLSPVPRPRHNSAYRPLSTRNRIQAAAAVEASRHNQASTMSSRPGSSQRPTHIPVPPPNLTGSPTGSPRPPSSPTSPRSSFLPSFMRTRSRTVTQPNAARGRTSPTPESPAPVGGSRDPSNGPPITQPGGGNVTRSVSTPVTGIMAAQVTTANGTTNDDAPRPIPVAPKDMKNYRIRLVPHLETTRSLAFEPVVREMCPIIVSTGITPSAAAASVTTTGPTVNGRAPALLLKIGRFTDKSQLPVPNTAATGSGSGTLGSGVDGPASLVFSGGGGEMTSSKVAFKSKVVSRSHAEIWVEPGGKFFIRDTASSSGTFLNHIRLSSPNTESRPTPINDGDVLQLGVDYQGGIEDMFRCVKMRVELGREWQRAANEFNTNALKQLKALGGEIKGKPTDSPVSSRKAKASVTDCCICLFSVTVCQSLFIAPCSHVFHYKCIRPLLMQHHPGFCCPLCRTFANLEEDVEEDAWEIASRRVSVISRRPSGHSIRLPPSSDGPVPPPGDDAPEADSSGVGLVAFGFGSASVEQLLSQPQDESSDDSVEMEGMRGASTLERHSTAVQYAAAHSGSVDIDMPDAVMEDAEPDTAVALGAIDRDLTVPNSLAALAGPSSSVAIPASGQITDHSMLIDAAQTPRNDTFLATLAPGVHQRIDLLSQGVQPLMALPEAQEEGNGSATHSNGDMHQDEAAERSSQSRVEGMVGDHVSGEQGEGEDGWVQFESDEAAQPRSRRQDFEMMFT